MTMPGIDIVAAANILSEIGNIERFPNASKLAKFAGIAPVNFSSAGKGKDMCPKQGNRRLQAIFYFLAIQMVQVAPAERRDIRYSGNISRRNRKRERINSRDRIHPCSFSACKNRTEKAILCRKMVYLGTLNMLK